MEMRKTRLTERFQQLAGIKSLSEGDRISNPDLNKILQLIKSTGIDPGDVIEAIKKDSPNTNYGLPKIGPSEEIMAAALLSTDDYKAVYFGDKEDFEEEGFEFIETFPITPYTLVMFSNEDLSVYDYDSEEELVEEFGEMGFGGCDEEECGIAEIIEVVNSLSADGSNPGLALLANGKEIANGGE